jgi:ubiquinone/menaquinone biosynthesis C-methylase UbiE
MVQCDNFDLKIKYSLGKHKYSFSFRIFESVLNRLSRNDSFVLDAGCGPNSPLLRLKKHSFAVGLDVSPSNLEKMAAELKRLGLGKIVLVKASASNLPFREGVFDIVAMRDVLEHLNSVDDTMRQMSYSMKRGAKILMTVTNILNPVMLCDSLLPPPANQRITSKFGIKYYERHTRPSPASMVESVKNHSMRPAYFSMFSIPPFVTFEKLDIYERKFPNYYYFWIAFEKLTNTSVTKVFKEIIFLVAEKTGY